MYVEHPDWPLTWQALCRLVFPTCAWESHKHTQTPAALAGRVEGWATFRHSTRPSGDQATVFQGSRKVSPGPHLMMAGAYTGRGWGRTCQLMGTGWGRNPSQDTECLGWRACIGGGWGTGDGGQGRAVECPGQGAEPRAMIGAGVLARLHAGRAGLEGEGLVASSEMGARKPKSDFGLQRPMDVYTES